MGLDNKTIGLDNKTNTESFLTPQPAPQKHVESFLTPQQYAHLRGVHLNTVMKWIREKKVLADQPSGRKGKWFIPAINGVTFTRYPES